MKVMSPFSVRDNSSNKDRNRDPRETSETSQTNDYSTKISTNPRSIPQPFKPSRSILMSDDSSKSEELDNKSKQLARRSKTSNSIDNQPQNKASKQLSDLDTILPKSCKERKFLVKNLENELSRLEIRLEVAENWDLSLDELDDSKSKYIQLHKLRERYRATWQRYCRITNFDQKNVFSKIKVTASSHPIVNQKMEEWISDFNQFPNFLDVQQQLERIYADLHGMAYDEPPRLNITASSLNSMASSIFFEIGLQIIKSRKRFYKFYFESYLSDADCDPADTDANLNQKLSFNFKIFMNAMDDVRKNFQQTNTSDNVDTVVDEIVSSDDEDPSEESSLSSLSELSISNDDSVPYNENDYSNHSTSSISRSFSLDSDDETSSFDQLYVDRLLASQNSIQTTPQNNAFVQTTINPHLLPSPSNLNFTSDIPPSHSTPSIQIPLSDSAKNLPVLAEFQNKHTSKRLPFVTISNNPQKLNPNQEWSYAVVPQVTESDMQKSSSANLPKRRSLNSKIFKLKPLTSFMIDQDNAVKMENQLKIPVCSNTNLTDSAPTLRLHASTHKEASSQSKKQDAIKYSMPPVVSNIPKVSAGLRPNEQRINTNRSSSDFSSNLSSRLVILPPQTNFQHESKQISFNESSKRNFSQVNSPSGTLPYDVEPYPTNLRSSPSTTKQPKLTKPVTLLCDDKNASFIITGSAVPYTPNFMPKIKSAEPNKTYEIIGSSRRQDVDDQDVIITKVSSNKKTNSTVSTSVCNSKVRPTIRPPSPRKSISNNASNRPLIKVTSKYQSPVLAVGSSTTKTNSTQGSKPTSHSRCNIVKPISIHSNTRSEINSNAESRAIRSAKKIKQRVEDISKFFDSQNVKKLTAEDFKKLNTAFLVMENLKKSKESCTTTSSKGKSKKKAESKNSIPKSSKLSTVDICNYEIPKVGKKKRKPKPVNPAQPSKKPKF